MHPWDLLKQFFFGWAGPGWEHFIFSAEPGLNWNIFFGSYYCRLMLKHFCFGPGQARVKKCFSSFAETFSFGTGLGRMFLFPLCRTLTRAGNLKAGSKDLIKQNTCITCGKHNIFQFIYCRYKLTHIYLQCLPRLNSKKVDFYKIQTPKIKTVIWNYIKYLIHLVCGTGVKLNPNLFFLDSSAKLYRFFYLAKTI